MAKDARIWKVSQGVSLQSYIMTVSTFLIKNLSPELFMCCVYQQSKPTLVTNILLQIFLQQIFYYNNIFFFAKNLRSYICSIMPILPYLKILVTKIYSLDLKSKLGFKQKYYKIIWLGRSVNNFVLVWYIYFPFKFNDYREISTVWDWLCLVLAPRKFHQDCF